jgi:5,10-methylenetetrahydromethanopterin reductase
VSRIALGSLGEQTGPATFRLAQCAEALGYDSIWVAETRYTRDAVTTAAAAGLATKGVGIGTAAINAFTRGVVLTAVTAATLDELTQGRLILGIGAGSPRVLEQQGINFTHPLLRLREYVEVVRQLLRGTAVTYEGQSVTVQNVQLDFTPPRSSIPIYLAVTGPRAQELAGEVADGVILNAFVSTAYTQRAITRIQAAAVRAGRETHPPDIAGCVVVSMDPDSERAKQAIRPLIGTYLATFPNIARESDIAADQVEFITQAFTAGGGAATVPYIVDEIVDSLTCAGSPDECRAHLARRRAAGVSMPILDIAFGDAEMVLSELAGS